jgi:hypothetical protein
MDEVPGGQRRRIHASALDDRHPLLHPQQRLGRVELRQEKPGPPAIARVSGEEF